MTGSRDPEDRAAAGQARSLGQAGSADQAGSFDQAGSVGQARSAPPGGPAGPSARETAASIGAASSGGFVVGIDGGGTRSRIAIADAAGHELLRRTGPAGLVDPRDPAGTAAVLVRLVRETAREADTALPVAALCAGLAGAGDPAMRLAVRDALLAAGIAARVDVVTDGVIALDGALAGEAGVLLVAGTGSVAYGRSQDGRVERCGGWGMIVGDEGSGYAIARAAIQAALQSTDGRAAGTRLLPMLLDATGVADPREIPSWIGCAGKGDVAALAPRVIALANEGDPAAADIVDRAAADLAAHALALLDRLGPWSRPVPVVFYGGGLGDASFAHRVETRLTEAPVPMIRRDAAADAVAGAVRHALELIP